MTLEIKLGTKREKRLMKHLKMEHPGIKGNIRVTKGNKKSINQILSGIPDFERQAHEATKSRKLLKGGRK